MPKYEAVCHVCGCDLIIVEEFWASAWEAFNSEGNIVGVSACTKHSADEIKASYDAGGFFGKR